MTIQKIFGALAVVVGLFVACRALTSMQGVSAFSVVTVAVGLLCAVVFAAFGIKLLTTKNI